MGDCPFAENHGKASDIVQTNSREHYMQQIPEEISKAASAEPKPDGQYDVLIVVDVQNDFITGSFKAHNAINIIDNLNTVIHVAGIALEYCVQATCSSAIERNKKTVALENAIAVANGNLKITEEVWKVLEDLNVKREKLHRAIGGVGDI